MSAGTTAVERPVPVTVAPRRQYFPELEGIRAVAAIGVMISHVGISTGLIGSQWFDIPGHGLPSALANTAEVGLPIFFVLSGMLLYRPFALATITGAPRPAAKPYFWRRALRILPAYWLLALVALPLLNRDLIHGVWEVVRPLLVLQVYQQDVIPLGMEQTWSIAVEVAFYLALPVAAIGLARFARRASDPAARVRRILVPLVLMSPIGFGYACYTHWPGLGGGAHVPMQHYWVFEYVGFLAAGMALATLSASAEVVPDKVPAVYRAVIRWPLACWAGAVAAYVLASSPLAGPKDTIDYLPLGPAMVNHVLYLAFAVLAVAPLTMPHARSRIMEAALANPVMRFLGRISYGIFLWHVVMQYLYHQFTGIPFGTGSFVVELSAVLLGSIVAATISYILVERPAMRLRPWLGKAPAGPSVATISA